MSVCICTTKNNLPLSRLIRWAFTERSSHFVLIFDHRIVVHTSLMGSKIEWKDDFEKHHEIVDHLDLHSLTPEEEGEIWEGVMQRTYGHVYDYGALFYFILRGFLYRFFAIPLPEQNRWQSDQRFLCTGVAQGLPEWLVNRKMKAGSEMRTPEVLYQIIEEQWEEWVKIEEEEND